MSGCERQTWACYLRYLAYWPKPFCVNNTEYQWRCELVKNRDRDVKKHKQGNKKKIQNSIIVFLCYRAQRAYKPALFQAQAKLMRRQVDITAQHYGEQLPFQRRSIFFCTDSSDRSANVMPQFDWGRLFPVSRAQCRRLRKCLQHKVFAEINRLNIFFTSGAVFLPSYNLLLIYLKLASPQDFYNISCNKKNVSFTYHNVFTDQPLYWIKRLPSNERTTDVNRFCTTSVISYGHLEKRWY
jgi:hypothetical protein